MAKQMKNYDLVIESYQKGMRPIEIAKTHKLTRGQVAGILYRSKILLREEQIKIKPTKPREKYISIKRNLRSYNNSRSNNLYNDLRSIGLNQCRFIKGEPNTLECCGDPVIKDKPYCANHSMRCYEKAKPQNIFIPVPKIREL